MLRNNSGGDFLLKIACAEFVGKAEVVLRSTNERFDRTLLPGVFVFQDRADLSTSVLGFTELVWLKCTAQSDIKVSAKSNKGNTDVSASVAIVIV